MTTFTVSLTDTQDETATAEYYLTEAGWVTFKTADHKAVAAYPEARVTRILREEPEFKVHFEMASIPDAEEMAKTVGRRVADAAMYGAVL